MRRIKIKQEEGTSELTREEKRMKRKIRETGSKGSQTPAEEAQHKERHERSGSEAKIESERERIGNT